MRAKHSVKLLKHIYSYVYMHAVFMYTVVLLILSILRVFAIAPLHSSLDYGPECRVLLT